MAKKKTYKTKPKALKVNEPLAKYGENRIHIFNSFEEQADFELKQMAALSSEEVLKDLRKFLKKLLEQVQFMECMVMTLINYRKSIL